MNVVQRALEIKFNWVDVALTKIAVLFAALFIAKIWPAALSLDIGWYLVIWIAAAIKPFATLINELRE